MRIAGAMASIGGGRPSLALVRKRQMNAWLAAKSGERPLESSKLVVEEARAAFPARVNGFGAKK